MGDQREAGVEGGMNSYIYIYRLPVLRICFQTERQLLTNETVMQKWVNTFFPHSVRSKGPFYVNLRRLMQKSDKSQFFYWSSQTYSKKNAKFLFCGHWIWNVYICFGSVVVCLLILKIKMMQLYQSYDPFDERYMFWKPQTSPRCPRWGQAKHSSG